MTGFDDFVVSLIFIWKEGLGTFFDEMHEATIFGLHLDNVVAIIIFANVILPFALRWFWGR